MFDSYDPEVGFGGIHGRGRRKQDPPIERELYLTLEEVFKGCVKKMKISRRVRTQGLHLCVVKRHLVAEQLDSRSSRLGSSAG